MRWFAASRREPGRAWSCTAWTIAMRTCGPRTSWWIERHERGGELLARLGVDELVTVGDQARMIAVGAEREGVEPERIHRCADVDQAVAVVKAIVRPGDLVLVKASRVARLERVAEALRREGVAPDPEARPAGAGAAGAAA